MIFKKNKDDDYLGVSRKRLFDQGTFSEGLKNLESVTLESTAASNQEPQQNVEPQINADSLQNIEHEEGTQLQEIEELQTNIERATELSPENGLRESRMADRLILSLEEQVAFLKGQLEVKDNQLQTKDELIRNFQVLIKQDQDTILMLENKLSEARTFDKMVPLQEDSDKNEKENAPLQAEVRYNRESKQKTTSSMAVNETKSEKKVSQGVVKTKRSFLSGWFGK